MEFTRKRQKGVDSKTSRMWMSDCGHYRITWKSEVYGVAIPPQFYAMVRCYANAYKDDQFWTFVGRRSPYRKMNAAVEASEKHQRLWNYAMKVSESERKGRNERLRVVDAKARIGTGPTCQRVMASLPVWVRGKANTILMNQMFPRPGSVVEEDDECLDLDQKDSSTPVEDSTKPQFDPTDLSLSTEQKLSTRRVRRSSSPTPPTPASGPVSDATVKAKSTTRTKSRTRLKATSSAAESSVPCATEVVASAGSSSRKRTKSSSLSTSSKRSGSKRSSKLTEPASAS